MEERAPPNAEVEPSPLVFPSVLDPLSWEEDWPRVTESGVKVVAPDTKRGVCPVVVVTVVCCECGGELEKGEPCGRGRWRGSKEVGGTSLLLISSSTGSSVARFAVRSVCGTSVR